MTCVMPDFGMMARDLEGSKLLRDTFESFLPDLFPEWNEDKLNEEIGKILEAMKAR